MEIETDILNNILFADKVSSYTRDPKDSVNTIVIFTILEDEWFYPANIGMEVINKEVKVI